MIRKGNIIYFYRRESRSRDPNLNVVSFRVGLPFKVTAHGGGRGSAVSERRSRQPTVPHCRSSMATTTKDALARGYRPLIHVALTSLCAVELRTR
jgi:hypothetical protein